MLISVEKLEELLVEPGHITKEDFDLAKQESEGKNLSLDRFLVNKGLVKDDNLGRIIADEIDCPFVDLKKANIDEISSVLLDIIPEVVAYSQKAIVFEENSDEIKIATSNPDDYPFFNLLAKKTEKKITPHYATSFDIEQALKRYKGDLIEEMRKLIKELEKDLAKGEENVVRLVDLIMEYAYNNMASDIHIEPLSKGCIIRFRIDGILHKVSEYPKKIHNRIVSRIKILSRLRTDEKLAAQDGKFQYNSTGNPIDVRVSIMPITEGENVVMRLLMEHGQRFSFDELGLLDHDLKKIKTASQKPYGMIVAVGPTGSGKTTTLYSVLQALSKSEVNIMTIEDPAEYNVEGVQQTQVNAAKGITFAKGLRSIVRQDPDIIMVGEIRDSETVDMALNSAMTGHLVLSSMHANDAATTFPRFLEMGAETFLIASSINVTVAQRLVRRICDECKKSYFLSEEELDIIKEEKEVTELIYKASGETELEKIRFYKGAGCKFCNNTGYDGRTAIFEVLEVSEDIRTLIVKKESSDVIKRKAIEEGMTTMIHDGVTKALMGVTTIEEVRKAAKA